MNRCWLLNDPPEPTVTLCYVTVLNNPEYWTLAERFIGTYGVCHPGVNHNTVILCNGYPTKPMKELFAKLPNVEWFAHDNTGYDIGGYISLARKMKTGPMFCCASSCHVRKAGWLRKVLDAWNEFGPGIYGTLATYEVRPHFCTTGFLVPAELMAAYPLPVTDKHSRYEFEHGTNSLLNLAIRSGVSVKLVTWDGVYDLPDWRKPENIYVRGDHSNVITFFRHSDSFELSSPAEKIRRAGLANTAPVPIPE
jgi:hypothetical protein